MTTNYSIGYLTGLIHELRNLSKETEWVEFKHNNSKPEEIGEYISALANSAALQEKPHAYLLWGINDKTLDIVGTTFKPSTTKIGEEALENWLLRQLEPKIHFHFFEFTADNHPVVLMEVDAAYRHPVKFKNESFFRLGSHKKKLKEFPDKERRLWRIFDNATFEKDIALQYISSEKIFDLLDYSSYFRLLEIPMPDGHSAILHSLQQERLIQKNKAGHWDITNLGAILFAKNLENFPDLKRKTLRIIQYKGKGRIETLRESLFTKGYAAGFQEFIQLALALVPSNELIGQALRETKPMYPELAVRELMANMLIHQDFFASGTGPMVEIFDDRMEITNPGLPLVETDRFLDTPPISRNEELASLMRRFGICEERGSGIDKVVLQTEIYQLPPPLFEITDAHTRVVLFGYKSFKDMDKGERVWACYLHACLHYVQRDFMTNTSLRKRFGIEDKNSAMASRIIKDTLAAGRIHVYDSTVGNKSKKYLPSWAK